MKLRKTVAKIFIGFLNILIGLSGLGCVGVGTWLARDEDFSELTGSAEHGKIFLGSYILIGIGGLLFITSILGSCGCLIESKCMILTYVVIASVFFIGTIASVGVIYYHYPDASDALKMIFENEIEKYPSNKKSRTFMNKIQKELKCCGIHSDKDYLSNDVSVPESCRDYDTQIIHDKGCFDEVKAFLIELVVILASVGAGILALQVVSIACSICLYCVLRPKLK